jgi:apolipoprotein N-acyltransferase
LSARLRVLVFPSALVALQFASSHGAHGSWGSAAYTQAGNLPLLQSLSVFGLWGITFLIGWFASTVNDLLERRPATASGFRNAAIFIGIFAGVIVGGGARLALLRPVAVAVRTASLSP